MAEVFLDSSFAIALSSSTDLHHERALSLADRLKGESTRLVTTRAVLIEIGNALARQRHRGAAIRLLVALDVDSAVEIVPLSEPLYADALRLFTAREDKEWGLTDAISFVVMQERGITEALTADVHFQQAGFRALLRVSSV